MAPRSHYQYPSAEAEFTLYNFHSQQQVDDLADVLALNDKKAPRVIHLFGEVWSGRHYLLRAAAHYARQRGTRVAVEELSLDGYEPDAPLRSLLAHLSDRATGELSGKFSELARRAKVEIRVSPVNLILASVGVKTDLTVGEISDFLQPTSQTRGPDMSDRERLRNFLNRVTQRQRLALYIRESQIIDVGLRLRLVDEAALNEKFLVAFGYPPGSAGALNPEREPFRLEVLAWTRKKMQRAFAERFQLHEAADDFLDFAWDLGHSARNRETFAKIVLRAVRSGCLLADSGGDWYVKHNWEEGEPFVQEFSRDLFEPVLQMETRLAASTFSEERVRTIRDFLRAAALCNPTIPVFPLLTMIGVSEAEKGEFIDCLDDLFETEGADGILEDLGFRHPGFPPSQLLYRFRNPIMPGAVLERQVDSSDWAVRVLNSMQEVFRPDTRAIANLFLRLVKAGQLENEATRYEKLLSYWTSLRETEALRASIVSELNARQVSPQLIWSVIVQSDDSWPPARQLALLEAYGTQRDGIPLDTRFNYFAMTAMTLHNLGRFNEAVDAVEQAKLSEWPEPKWHCELLLHYMMALIETRFGRSREAEKHGRSALRIAGANLPPKHPSIANTLKCLANVLCLKGQYGVSRELFQRALVIEEEVLDPKHPQVANTLNLLGNVLVTEGQYSDARELFQRALAIREEVFGTEHPKAADTLTLLGIVLVTEGQYSDARLLFQRALAIREEVFGPKHPDVAVTLNNLGAVLYAEGQYGDAREILQRALAIREEVFGPKHPDVAVTLNNLGAVLYAEGQYGDAREILQRALAIREEVFGPKHPEVATTLNLLGNLLAAEGQYSNARLLFQRALAIREEVFGPKHPKVADTLNLLGNNLLVTEGQYSDARELLQRALAIYEQVFGPKHPEVATTLNNLGAVLYAEGKYGDARELLQRALVIREEVFGPKHPKAADTLNLLGNLLAAEGQYSDARLLFQRALAIREEVFGPKHPEVATTLDRLGTVLDAEGQYSDAQLLFQRASAIREDVLHRKRAAGHK